LLQLDPLDGHLVQRALGDGAGVREHWLLRIEKKNTEKSLVSRNLVILEDFFGNFKIYSKNLRFLANLLDFKI
jgi:hypothetical protein